MKKLFKMAFMVAAFLGAQASAGAQEPMTLKDCMEYAVSNSTKMRIQQADIRDAQVERRSAILEAFTPSVSAGTYAYSNFGRSVDPETNTYRSTTSFQNGYQASGSISLFNGFQGDPEYKLCPIYVVSILNFTLPELDGEENVLSTFRLKELNTGRELSNKYTFVFIELGKFNKQLHQLDKSNILEGFYYCLKHMSKLQERPLELQQEIMARLFEAAQVAAMQPEELEKYISTMVTERDIRNYISYAQEKGRDEGRAEGRAEGLAEGEVIGETKGIHKTARNMKAKGISVEMIMECTGLSVEEIERL